MSEDSKTSIYPIIYNTLSDDTDEDVLSDDEVCRLTNKICQRIDKQYTIEKREVK